MKLTKYNSITKYKFKIVSEKKFPYTSQNAIYHSNQRGNYFTEKFFTLAEITIFP